jgi:hypothetical protein
MIRQTINLDPKATYLRTSQDPDSLDSQPTDLQSLGFNPGDIVSIQGFGSYNPSVVTTDPPYPPATDVLAVFSKSDVLLASDNLNRVFDAIPCDGVRIVTPPTLYPTGGSLPTDIPEDLCVSCGQYRDCIVTIPDGAGYIFFSPNDSFFSDNGLEGGQFGAIVTNVIPGVDYSAKSTANQWEASAYTNSGQRAVVVTPWSGLATRSAALSNFTRAATVFSNIAGYAVVNNNNLSTDLGNNYPPKSDQRGDAQINRAFSVLGQDVVNELAFMAIDVEPNVDSHNHEIPPAPGFTIARATQRYADAVQTVWRSGVPAVIYTTSRYWKELAGNEAVDFDASIPLWDAQSGTDTLENFIPYGPWTQRLGRQYSLDQDLAGLGVDYNVFDTRIWKMERPPLNCTPAITARPTIVENGTEIELHLVIGNDAAENGSPACKALACRLTSVTFQCGSTAVQASANGILITPDSPLKMGVLDVGALTPAVEITVPKGNLELATLKVQFDFSCGGGRYQFSMAYGQSGVIEGVNEF